MRNQMAFSCARLLVVAALTVACSEAIASSSRYQHITVSGRRGAWLWQPNSTTRAAVVVLHGSDCFALNMSTAGFEQLSSAPTVAYAEMEIEGSSEWGYAKDLAYFDTLAARLREVAERVYVVGHSAGGSMSLYLQNQMRRGTLDAAAAVEAGVGQLRAWDMSATGVPTMVVWNSNDPVLAEYGGAALYNQTIKVLRRKGHCGHASRELPVSRNATMAAVLDFPACSVNQPDTAVLQWHSAEPTHQWPHLREFGFDATQQIYAYWEHVRKQEVMLL